MWIGYKIIKNLSTWIETQKKVFFKNLTVLTGGSKDVEGKVIEKKMGIASFYSASNRENVRAVVPLLRKWIEKKNTQLI